MVEISFRNKKFEVKENMTARDALKKINIDPESVLISVNGKLVTDDYVLREGDVVKLVAVISGGEFGEWGLETQSLISNLQSSTLQTPVSSLQL
jgi:thiamine biosynthesis protein ThiS